MLVKRIITAVVLLIALVLLVTLSTPFVFSIVIGAIVLLAAREWTHFIGLTNLMSQMGYLLSVLGLIVGMCFLLGIGPSAAEIDQLRVLVIMLLGIVFWCGAFVLLRDYPENKDKWADQSHIALMGIFVLLPAWVGFVQLKYLDNSGIMLLSGVALISVADIGAYFAGKAFGDKKLAPDLSPKKTRAGVWGGMISCLVLALILLLLTNLFAVTITWSEAFLLMVGTLLMFAVSVVGDLFISMMKRVRHLKDSGHILPGHGGVLDRVDSHTAATPVFVILMLTIFGNPWAL